MSKGSSEGIVLNQDRSVEAQLERAKEERQKKMKKQKRRKWILIGAVAAVILLVIIVSVVLSAISKNMPMTVFTTTPTKGDLESVINASGTIESQKEVNYYAPGNILVAENASLGDKVSAGDSLVIFEEEDFAFVLREAELQDQITNNTYQSNLTNYDEYKSELATANANIKKYQDLVNTQKAVVDNLTATVTDANAIKVAELQTNIYKAQKNISDYTYYVKNWQSLGMTAEAAQTYQSYIVENENNINAWTFEINQLTGGVDTYNGQKALTDAKQLLADYEAELEKAKAQKEACENAMGNSYDAENIILNGELTTMRTGQAYDELLVCQDGVKAEFDGVITACNVESGAKTAAGSVMITLSSLEEVKVTFSVTKSNLKEVEIGQKAVVEVLDKEYEATVTRINSIATSGTNGSTSILVEVSLDNPDNSIYLGLDAKVKLTTASKTDVVMLPVEAVNADKEGEFVYLVTDGIVEKRYITLGISSDEYVEVVEGLAETDQVITMISSDIEDGMPVMAIPTSTVSEMSDEELDTMLEGM